MRRLALSAALLCFLFSIAAFAQTGINATLSGTVSDPSGALIPGVDVTARNVDTGVSSSSITNESGTYRFPSLQPGNYEVSGSLPGFQRQTYRLTLGTSQQIRQNFTLQVGAVTQTVEVTIAADQLLTASTASVGTVLGANQLIDLPLVTRNVMDLATTLPGVTGEGGANSTFGGVSANGSGNIGISMDGVTMNTGRHTQGLKTSFFVNPDMIDEIRVVVAPIDVEGRGAAQVQMRARTGTNQFRGAATWNLRNSALNANSWANNRLGAQQIWYNRHQSTVSLGGPILKGKTFFFALYDRQDQRQKATVNGLVLTPEARAGTFRFFPGVNNGNADTTASGTGATRVAAVVNKAGTPLDWTQIPGATGPMRSFNVFGGDGINPGDPFRTRMDPSGYMTNFLKVMPLPNAYDGTVGDGLNTATIRWVRRTVGGSAGGTGEVLDAYNRKQINLKIDHHFNQNHRLSGNWVRETHYTDNNNLSNWPTGYNGQLRENPRVRSLNFTSTLSPNLLNEFRYAYRVTTLHWDAAIETPGIKDEALKYLPVINGYPVYVRPTLFNFPNHVLGSSGDFGNTSPLTTFGDNVSWTKGAHAFKGGVEFRYAHTAGYQPTPVTSVLQGLIPTITGGAGDIPVRGIDTLGNIGLLTNNITLAQNLLLALSGSVASTSMRFETWEPTDTKFLDYKESYNHANQPEGTRGKIRQNHQNEFNLFFKDDWKVTPSLTLNLGVRWDLFRVSDFRSGTGANWTRGPVEGNSGYFGISGRTFGEAFHNGGQVKADPTRVVLIGKDSKHPDLGLWPSDRNNFSPAFGFSWSPSFGGKDKTTVRGGWQVTHLLPGNSLSWIDADSGRLPGLEFQASSAGGSTYRDFSTETFPLAYPSSIPEVVEVRLDNRSAAQAFFSPDYVTPYVMTTTLGVTRSLPGGLIADVRYVGTRGVKLHSSINYNEPDFRLNGLMNALNVTRAGGDDPMFDRMFRGLNFGTANAPLIVGNQITGSEALRRNAAFRTNLANGDFRAVANVLNTTNIGVTIPAGETIAGATLRSSGQFNENFIVANPQFAAMEMRWNAENSQYHSMQTQVTKRLANGMTYQATWTWSRSTGVGTAASTGGGPTATYRDFLNRRADYSVHTFHRVHDIRGYGTFELPFGPGKWLGTNAGPFVARLIEGWQMGTILNLTTGSPLDVEARNTINRTGTPDIVGDFPRKGKVNWEGTTFGNYFSEPLYRVTDPACLGVPTGGAANLRSFCTNSAISTDAAGTNLILRNAAPGQLGSLGLRPIYGPGSWDFDANLQKKFRIDESRSLTVRINASNVLNHPTPGNPNLDINSGTFGEIGTKTGSRTLSGQLRLDF